VVGERWDGGEDCSSPSLPSLIRLGGGGALPCRADWACRSVSLVGLGWCDCKISLLNLPATGHVHKVVACGVWLEIAGRGLRPVGRVVNARLHAASDVSNSPTTLVFTLRFSPTAATTYPLLLPLPLGFRCMGWPPPSISLSPICLPAATRSPQLRRPWHPPAAQNPRRKPPRPRTTDPPSLFKRQKSESMCTICFR
jgi:hypothetical protein